MFCKGLLNACSLFRPLVCSAERSQLLVNPGTSTSRQELQNLGIPRLFLAASEGETWDPGCHSQCWEARSSGGCKSPCPFPSLSPLFQFCLFSPHPFAWPAPLLPVWVHVRGSVPALFSISCSVPAQQKCLDVPTSPYSCSSSRLLARVSFLLFSMAGFVPHVV